MRTPLRRWQLLVVALATAVGIGGLGVATAPVAVAEPTPAPTPAPLSYDLKVGSFNLYGANNDKHVSSKKKWSKRQPVAAAQILGENLDVVGLQEASSTSDQAGGLAATINAQAAAKGLSNRYDVVRPVDPTTGGVWFSNSTKIIYNATRVQPLTSGVFTYVNQATSNRYKQRFVAWATFQVIGTDKQFFFANTHLDPYSKKKTLNSVKVRQWRELIALVPQLNVGKLPVVVTGDFNTSKWWKEAQTMLPAMSAAGFGDLMNQRYQVSAASADRSTTVINGWINSYNGFRTNVKKYSYYKNRSRVGNGVDWIFASNSLTVKKWKVVINFDPKKLKTVGVIPSDHCMISAIVVL